MLVIRNEQMVAFRELAKGLFENEMVSHLTKVTSPLGHREEDRLREAIRFGIERAQSYGFNLRGPVRIYLEMMLSFGSFFNNDPQYPWAREILLNLDSEPQMQRAKNLHAKTLDYSKRVDGPDNLYRQNAALKVSAYCRRPFSGDGSKFQRSILQELPRLYPEKAAHVGEEGLRTLLFEAYEAAIAHGFSTSLGRTVTALTMFFFGHGCFADPLYPWISETFEDERISGAAPRSELLKDNLIEWLGRLA